ncbi:MAG: TonB-dependent receptor [Bacteroidales bacterium]|nr:TonB-dependent receptor [Bacteroidales bacterium]
MIIRNKFKLLFLFTFACLTTTAQEKLPLSPTDSIPVSSATSQEVVITGYLKPQFKLQTPTSVSILSKKDLELQSSQSMLPAVNTVPGVRMEERSPGSYRLSIRGSLIRSPYGVRNVKVYYNDFSLTDAGGNTYLNVLNVNDLSGIEVLKGPDGSLFGANSGGVVFLRSNVDTLSTLNIQGYGGSYGLFGESFHLSRNTGNHFWSIRQSFQRADGYRENTRNHRLFIQLSDKWQYKPGNSLEFYAFYSDLDYFTPGGLTHEQYVENPRQARPATATMPGSVEQKTRISTKMYFGGIHHKMNFMNHFSHQFSIWGNHVDFIYPFITNYEIRNEDNWGLRTFLSWDTNKPYYATWNASADIGLEGQRLVTDAYNYDNHAGEKGDIQAYNNILNYQFFPFLRGKFRWEKILVEAAVSVNMNGYHFRDITLLKKDFPREWMPHIALNYRISDPVALRLTFSKGYSIPTTAEVRPSDNKIHYNLNAEKGWNIETGVRFAFLNGRLSGDLSVFHYLLQDGIISQMDSLGNTYFINSGKIRQIGVEYSSSFLLIPYSPSHPFLKKLSWNCSYTYAHYNYDQYKSNGNDYSNNRVAGIPRNVLINSLELNFPFQIYCFIQHNYTSRIPLNDANSEFADSYHLLSAKLGAHLDTKPYLPSSVHFFADNILNQKYSLGNDLNAFGKRYYNAAPTFNFQIGVKWEI